MKALICGAGSITRELLKRLGDGWSVTLIDKSEEKLEKAVAVASDVVSIHAEDASSPVVLDKAGLTGFDYLLALTDDDQVNAAAARFAVEKGVPHVLSLLRGGDGRKGLTAMGVHVIHSSDLVASKLFHYLQDPRIRVTPLSSGPGTLMEINASDEMRIIGKPASYFDEADARLVGVFRDDALLFPSSSLRIKADDRLLILGRTSVYDSVCGLLQCGSPHFPLAYGSGLLIVISGEKTDRTPPILGESLYFAQNSHIRTATVLKTGDADIDDMLSVWPQDMEMSVKTAEGATFEAVRRACGEGDFGLVAMTPPESSILKSLTGQTLAGLARELDRPLLVARGTMPYKRLLVPFSASAMSELAVEIAVDLARQTDAEIALAVIEEPEFIGGEDSSKEAVMSRVRELSRIHKTRFAEVLKQGNPVKELAALSAGYDLMVVGSSNQGKGILAPNVGESLVRRAQCSVLLTAS